MVAIAIIAIIAAIAIPAYKGYVREARLGIAKLNASTLQVFLEDHHLDYSTYIIGGDTTYTTTELTSHFGWQPDSDGFTYTVSVTANTYQFLAVHNSGDWLFCEDNQTNCCDNKTPGATTTDCP